MEIDSQMRFLFLRQVFKDAIKLDSIDVQAFVNLGILYFNVDRIDEARNYYFKAISLDPQNSRAHYNLGLLFSDQDDLESAKQEFSKAVELEPGDADAKAELDSINERFQNKKR